jgi:hypothetical protein
MERVEKKSESEEAEACFANEMQIIKRNRYRNIIKNRPKIDSQLALKTQGNSFKIVVFLMG